MQQDDNIKDVDVLDILGVPSQDNTQTTPTTDTNNNTAVPVTPVQQTNATNPVDLNNLFGLNSLYDTSANTGTGDVTQDLINWLTDSDKLPSNPLASFLSNANLKSEFALYFMLMNNVSRIKVLSEFVKQSELILYNTDDIITLSPDDLKERYENATKALDNVLEQSRRVVSSVKKDKKEEELDKLKMLLGALPANKLKEIINSLK